MTGGVDIDPARYGEARHETVTSVEPDRDAFEFALLHAAREARLPVFGICRGLQVMNVALGGTLVQDIASQMSGHPAAHRANPAVRDRARGLGQQGQPAVDADAGDRWSTPTPAR